MKKSFKSDWPVYLIFLGIAVVVFSEISGSNNHQPEPGFEKMQPDYWVAPSLYLDNTTRGEKRKMVIYGQDILANTAAYFGPEGSVSKISNGMNCQNCHLDAGSRPWGNNYGAVVSTYPKFRARSGTKENIPKRINDCFERSLNGKAIDTAGYEMRSIIAYMQWLGEDVKKGDKPKGTGINDLPFLDRAASPSKGELVYIKNCQSCHGISGEGVKNTVTTGYVYPPLWGDNSYNSGAGLFRISRLAGYAKDNMPFNLATHDNPVLTDEEAWDVAAFINSQPRPKADMTKDWPDISAKPFDHPFGPYTDGFPEEQHKYGPFAPIADKKKELKKLSSAMK